MYINKLTGEIFNNRKEAKQKLGRYYYEKLLKDKTLFITDYVAYHELQENNRTNQR